MQENLNESSHTYCFKQGKANVNQFKALMARKTICRSKAYISYMALCVLRCHFHPNLFDLGIESACAYNLGNNREPNIKGRCEDFLVQFRILLC